MSYAPIALFVYNRPFHTQQTVDALKRNLPARESDILIFSDAARDESAQDGVKNVRDYIRTVTGFKSVTIIERTHNLGLLKSIVTGVTEVLRKRDSVIVMEDDLVCSSCLLQYMNDALEMFKNEERVISVMGWTYPVKGTLPETFFLRGADCLGWATWKRGWALFEENAELLYNELTKNRLTKKFDINGTYPYTRMLKRQVTQGNTSWAIRWYASAFLKNKLTLYPGKSLIRHIGNDGSGTNFGTGDYLGAEISELPVRVREIPVEENMVASKAIEEYLKSIRIKRILGRLRRLLPL